MKNPPSSRSSVRAQIFWALVCFVASCIPLTFASAQNCDVTWKKADGPHVISGTVTIPANQTVCVEAGVDVQFQTDAELDLFGKIVGAGTSASPIRFIGPTNSFNNVLLQGTLDLQFAEMGVRLALNGGTLFYRNGTFVRHGMINAGTASFVSLDQVVFDSDDAVQSANAAIFASGLTAVFKNLIFRNHAYFAVANSFLYIDNIISQNSAYDGLSFTGNLLQPTYLSALNITNTAGAGLVLDNGNFEFGDNVVLQNTENPVRGSGGILPGSQVPSAGNRHNWINATAGVGGTTYAPLAIPYVMAGFSGDVNFLPGVRIQLSAGASFTTMSGTLRALGLPDAPITIEPFVAGQKWNSGQFNSEGDRLEYVTLDGSDLGIVNAGGAGATFYIDNSILRNHGRALARQDFVPAFVQGTLFNNNGTAIEADQSTRPSGLTNPNLFEGNTVALTATAGSNPDARYNWWNSPSGPKASNNPGGIGEVVNGTAQISPFRTARPDTNDHPPVVRIVGSYENVFEPGSKVLLSWNSSDDHQLVRQKIVYSPSGNVRESFIVVADNLPGMQTSFEFTVPNIGFQASGLNAFVRVMAFDDKGQEGWDEWQVLIPSGEETGNLQITSAVAGQTFVPPRQVPLTWNVTQPFQNSSFEGFLLLDADHKTIPLGGGDTHGTFSTPQMPFVSTDLARFAVRSIGSTNRQKWFYSPTFAIRPDSRWIDTPPQITLNTPADGQQFTAQGSVVISWSASDNDALRRFDIQVSLNQGRTWQTLVENLPAATRSYTWKLPPNGGANADARIRVIAVDRRFQNSSAGQTRSIQILAGTGAPVPTRVVSRKTHGTAGTFDVGLPLSGAVGVECRSGGPNQLVVFFPNSVTVDSAAVVSGTGAVTSITSAASQSTPALLSHRAVRLRAASATQVTINLSGVTDAQSLLVSLFGVSDGSSRGDVLIPVGVLLADATADGANNSADIAQTKGRSGQSVTAANFRSDLNLDGSINSSDISLAKSRSGIALP